MTGLPSSYETDGRHHREADGQHQPPGDVTIGEGKYRTDESRDQPDPPSDLGVVVPHPSEQLAVSFATTFPELH